MILLDFITESILTEGATPILYHKTGLANALQVIDSGEFLLSSSIGNDAESKLAVPGYPYYLSTTRSKVGDYHRWVGDTAVMFVMDGTAISQRYLVKPVDYWERMWAASPERTRESEDRIYSKRNTMPINSVKEVHVLIKQQDERRSEEARQLLLKAKARGIKAYLYTDDKDWRLQNKAKAVDIGASGNLLKGHRKEPTWMRRPVRGQGRGDDAYGRSSMLAWIELIKKQPGQPLTKAADKLRYNIQYYSDAISSLKNDFFNSKRPGNPEYPLVVKLGDYMTKNKMDFNDLQAALKNKWKNK
jgi:hypothetical protein